VSEQTSDAELVGEALRGRGEAFGELVTRYRDAVFGVAFHRLGDFEEARDVAQEAFLKAYLSLADLRDPAAFASWLYRIADGTAVDAARRSRREGSLAEAEEVPAPQAATTGQSDIARQVQQALAGLGEQSRLAVILHYVNGYTHAEIARFLGATPQAVKTRLSRARGKLREEMAEMAGERIKRAAGGPIGKMQRFAPPAIRVVQYAKEEARRSRGKTVGTEHVLLGLIREQEGVAARVLEQLGVSLGRAQDEIRRQMDTIESRAPGQTQRSWRAGARRVLELAPNEARELNTRLGLPDLVDTEHLLLGLISETDSTAVRVLRALGVDFGRVRIEVVKLVAKERIKEAPTHLYRYIAKDCEGKTVTGTSKAASEAALAKRLRSKGYFVQKVEGFVPGPEATPKETERNVRAYSYEAVPSDGRDVLITGTAQATSPRELRQRLKKKGYTVTKVSRHLAPGSEEAAPIVRIVDVILQQAVKDHASSIRIELQPEVEPKGVVIRYLIEGVWREVMAVPKYVWAPLRQELADRADLKLRQDGRRQTGEMSLTLEERSYVAKATFQRRGLRLDLAPDPRPLTPTAPSPSTP